MCRFYYAVRCNTFRLFVVFLLNEKEVNYMYYDHFSTTQFLLFKLKITFTSSKDYMWYYAFFTPKIKVLLRALKLRLKIVEIILK